MESKMRWSSGSGNAGSALLAGEQNLAEELEPWNGKIWH
jgi:hypothetical protein